MVRTLDEGLDIEAHLRKIKDLFRLAQQIKENRDLFSLLQLQIASIEREALITDADLSNRFRAEVVEPFAKIKERLGQVEENPKLTVSQVTEVRDRVAKCYDDREWNKLEEAVQGFMGLSKSGEWVEDDAKPLVFEIANYKRSADIIQKFEKRKVAISTILYSPNTGSVAVVNGKQLSVGDALDGDGQVTVAEIGENYVIFQTEGVEIKRMQGAQ